MGSPVDDVAVHARLQPDRLAAIELGSGQRWTYADLDDAIGRCATVLAELGLNKGDRLAAFARNRLLLVILHLACARIGAIYVPLNWRLSGTEIDALIADCNPALLIHDDGEARGLRALSVAEMEERIDRATPAPAVPFDRERPSLILYTSGTSGRAKGVVHSERSLAETAINFSLLGRVTPESRVLNDSPMFHVIGLITNIRPALLQGGVLLISEGFDAERTLARIADPALGATHYFGVPQMASMLRMRPEFDPDMLRGLTALFTGGAPNPAADIMAWAQNGIAMVNGYGMSENGTLIGMPVDLAEIRKRPSSAGVPTSRVQIRIVDDQDQPLNLGETGEVQVRGPNLASGYWRRPDETAKAFLADGWFRTGDIGMIDEAGFVSIVDRKKDMFISGGENVYPAEIEAAVADFPGIAECAVVGVPDSHWGEVGHLFVACRAGSALDQAALDAHLASRLARYKLPRHVRELDALPRNGAGKVVKADLRALFVEEDA